MDFAQANTHVGAAGVAGSSIDTSSNRKYLGRRHNSRLRSKRRRTDTLPGLGEIAATCVVFGVVCEKHRY